MPSSAWKTDECSRSEEHTSELQSLTNLVCRLLLEKEINAEQMEYLKKGWGEHHATPLTALVRGADQRPVTVILENRQNLPAELTGGLDSLAVRLPKNEFLIKMISKVGFPLVSTSLNKAGQPPLSNLNNLGDYFEILPDLALSVGTIAGAKPSKLVDLRDVKNIKVIRE